MIYYCIPAHDEASTIGVLMWKIRNVMRSFERDYQVLVLDDGSGDGTAETVARYRTSIPVSVLSHDRRVGYGASVGRLLAEVVERSTYPKRDSAVVIQADFTEDPADAVSLLKTIEGGADIVSGVESTEEWRSQPRSIRWMRRCAPVLMGRGFRAAPVSDPLCGLRAYRVIVLKKALREGGFSFSASSGRWAASAEILAKLAPHARRIEEVELSVKHDRLRRQSRFRPLKVAGELLRSRRGLQGTEAYEHTS